VEGPNFPAQIEQYLEAIAALYREVGSPGWANHITLILGDPQDLRHTVVFGDQDLGKVLRYLTLVHLQRQTDTRRQQEAS
jgi:hypothetical protein